MLTLRHPAATTITANKPQAEQQQHVGCQKIKSIKRIWLLPSQGAIYISTTSELFLLAKKCQLMLFSSHDRRMYTWRIRNAGAWSSWRKISRRNL